MESIISLFNNLNNIDLNEKDGYIFNLDNVVPRVTHILQSMLNEEYIARWANSLGFRHIQYSAALQEAADKGTYTHNAIEKYLKNNEMPNIEFIPLMARESVDNAFGGFLEWYTRLKRKNKVDLIFSERKLICKYFGGTLDCLLSINGKLWLIDFKTTNNVSYKHFLQLAAYKYMLEDIEKISISGCLILQLDKRKKNFNEYILDLYNQKDKKYIEDCTETFMSIVYAYYNRMNVESEFKEIILKKKG